MHYFLGYSFEFFDDPKIAIKMFIPLNNIKKKITKTKSATNCLQKKSIFSIRTSAKDENLYLYL